MAKRASLSRSLVLVKNNNFSSVTFENIKQIELNKSKKGLALSFDGKDMTAKAEYPLTPTQVIGFVFVFVVI